MVYRCTENEDEGTFLSGTRVCRACLARKSIKDFHWAGKHSYRCRSCKACDYEKQRKRKANRPAESLARTNREGKLRRNYGLTALGWQQLWAEQNGKCAICSADLTKRKTHVDHDHRSNRVRGLLCFTCNTALGKFRDSVDILQAAAEYLRRPYPEIDTRSRNLSSEERKKTRSEASKRQFSDPRKPAIRLLRYKTKSEERGCRGGKLTDKQRASIIEAYGSGKVTQADIAKEFGISQSSVSATILAYRRLKEKVAYAAA